MKLVKSWYFKVASHMAALALLVASVSVSATCFFMSYQPDVPETLQ